MEVELAAKKLKHEAYTLYQVPLQQCHTPEESRWALSVPGLREGRPLVETGDEIQLRQLWVNSMGALTSVPTYIAGQ
jgi:hypothetical protein